MEIILDNILWMAFNSALAVFAVACGWIVLKAKSKITKMIFGIMWILFLPNTIYILSDIIHFILQLNYASNITIIAISLQYLLLMSIGILSFVYGVYPLEMLLRLKRFKTMEIYSFIIIFNFIIIFGVFLGRIHRLNSWDIFINPSIVIDGIKYTILSFELMISVFIFGLIASFMYFLLRKTTVRLTSKVSWIFD